MYNDKIIYRASGIFAYELSEKDGMQMTLFRNENIEKGSNASNVLDKLEYKFGKGVISIGTSGIKSIQDEHQRVVGLKNIM